MLHLKRAPLTHHKPLARGEDHAAKTYIPHGILRSNRPKSII